jgi:hypothetical protein
LLGLQARVALASVVTPDVSLGGLVLATFRPMARLPHGPSFGLGVGHLSNAIANGGGDAEPHVVTRLTNVLLRACPMRVGASSWAALEPCLTGKGGFLEADGRGLSHPETVVRSWWSLGAEVALEVALAHGFSISIAPSFDVPLVKRRFTLGEPPEAAGETPAVSAGVSLGIGYDFQ